MYVNSNIIHRDGNNGRWSVITGQNFHPKIQWNNILSQEESKTLMAKGFMCVVALKRTDEHGKICSQCKFSSSNVTI